MYIIKIEEIQRPKQTGPMGETWYKMTGKEMYKRELTPTLKYFKKEILKELGYKYEN